MLNWTEIVILLMAGFAVGFINTIAGGATVVSLASLIFLGLPMGMANATHRVAAFFQTLSSSGTFLRQKLLDLKTGLKLGIPVTLGSVIGAWIAVDLSDQLFEYLIGSALLILLLAMVFKPGIWLRGKLETPVLNPKPWHYAMFFLTGLYGGLIYIGIGYFLLAALVIGTGFDVVRANALKSFIVMIYVPFTLVLFIVNDMINWHFAMVLSVGQAVGAITAARLSTSLSTGFFRWLMIVFILLTLLQLFGVLDIRTLFMAI